MSEESLVKEDEMSLGGLAVAEAGGGLAEEGGAGADLTEGEGGEASP